MTLKKKLENLSLKLRTAHRRFLNNERVEAEKYFGRAINPMDFFRLLTEDKNFEWMRPFSAMIADIDAFTDEAEAISMDDLKRIRLQVFNVLRSTEEASTFNKRYSTHLNEDPDFVMLHADVMKALDELVAPPVEPSGLND